MRLLIVLTASSWKSFVHYSAASTRFFFPRSPPRRASTGFKNAPV